MNECDIFCLDTQCSLYTWTNNRVGNQRIDIRLDRAFCNNNALGLWRFVECSTLVRHNSDHHPTLLNCSRLTVLSPKPFHFYSMWVSHSNFLPDVKLFWSSLNFTGNPMVLLQRKLKMLRAFLRN